MLIQFDNVTRQFNNLRAVDEASFVIDRGEIVGLLGHNGAGKTTIMKMLTGFLEPTQGNIVVDGLSIEKDLAAIQANIGYLPENCPLWPDMTIVEFLLFQATLKGIAKEDIDGHVEQVIRQTNLVEKATQAIGTLSKGYRQRVGVANAILNRPKIIILDEPTNGLDPTQISDMRALIKELATTSTVILSTHIMQEVEAVCERVIIVRSGKIVTDARLSELDQAKGLRVVIDHNETDIKSILSDTVAGDSIQLKDVQNGVYQYLLNIDASLAPKISNKLLTAGYQLFELTPERENLESLFRDDYRRH